MIHKIPVPTSWGVIVCTLEGERMQACRLPLLNEIPPVELRVEQAPVPAACRAFLQQMLAGQPAAPSPYQWPAGTPFQRQVWQVLARIPYGRTMTYGDVATAIGCPGAARAVGRACGTNPLPLWIPCHRVVAANNKIRTPYLGSFL
jgi:methylated-DNA-[protein]-cysteine S-methyltransferase